MDVLEDALPAGLNLLPLDQRFRMTNRRTRMNGLMALGAFVLEQACREADYDVRELMQQVQAQVSANATTKWQTLYEKEDNVFFEWADNGPQKRYEITRIFNNQGTVYRISYVANTARLAPEIRDRWLKIIAFAKVAVPADN